MASIWTARTRFLLLLGALLLSAKLAREIYQWYAYADEREVLSRVSIEIDSAAVVVIRTQLRADSLRHVIEAADERLRADRLQLDRIERRADGRGLPPQLYEEYREGLDRYNDRVAARNKDYELWRGIVERNHHAVASYNTLADSMRLLGRRMGEPHIAIPSPSEAAVRHGLDTALDH